MTVVLRVKYSGWGALGVRRSRRGSPSGRVGEVFGRSGCSASEQLLSGGQVCSTSAATGLDPKRPNGGPALPEGWGKAHRLLRPPQTVTGGQATHKQRPVSNAL